VLAPLGIVSGVPLASYEFNGAQYIAAAVGKGLWTFKLGGTLEPRPAPPRPATEEGPSGIVKQLPGDGSGEIVVAPLNSSNPSAQFVDEYSFSPMRARIKAGSPIKWTNHGALPHTIVSDGGAWTTGPIEPGQSSTIRIETPGTYTFFSKEYPWARGSLVVQ
jgi:plastocyanin